MSNDLESCQLLLTQRKQKLKKFIKQKKKLSKLVKAEFLGTAEEPFGVLVTKGVWYAVHLFVWDSFDQIQLIKLKECLNYENELERAKQILNGKNPLLELQKAYSLNEDEIYETMEVASEVFGQKAKLTEEDIKKFSRLCSAPIKRIQILENSAVKTSLAVVMTKGLWNKIRIFVKTHNKKCESITLKSFLFTQDAANQEFNSIVQILSSNDCLEKLTEAYNPIISPVVKSILKNIQPKKGDWLRVQRRLFDFVPLYHHDAMYMGSQGDDHYVSHFTQPQKGNQNSQEDEEAQKLIPQAKAEFRTDPIEKFLKASSIGVNDAQTFKIKRPIIPNVSLVEKMRMVQEVLDDKEKAGVYHFFSNNCQHIISDLHQMEKHSEEASGFFDRAWIHLKNILNACRLGYQTIQKFLQNISVFKKALFIVVLLLNFFTSWETLKCRPTDFGIELAGDIFFIVPLIIYTGEWIVQKFIEF